MDCESSPTTQRLRCLSVILLTTHPEIDWKNVKGLRDIIAHHYFEVDADQIWWIIENELQPLKKAIQEMIESLKRILDE